MVPTVQNLLPTSIQLTRGGSFGIAHCMLSARQNQSLQYVPGGKQIHIRPAVPRPNGSITSGCNLHSPGRGRPRDRKSAVLFCSLRTWAALRLAKRGSVHNNSCWVSRSNAGVTVADVKNK
ncbi:hypothetical protein AMECASPLE_033221 [Ameca splendens]|uniref:Uncharacterized protein n=1 Tax=Ameca splendens TaxID=208324 RepID=A0ABV0ZFW4_9TELE